MVGYILALLPAADATHQEIAVRVEDYLWKRSANMEEYENKATLKGKLQSLRDVMVGAWRKEAAAAVEDMLIVACAVKMGQMSSDPKTRGNFREEVLLQQQQRLLHLRHASKCVHVNDRCPQGVVCCQQMKDVWKHIPTCREPRCQFAHCVSSRYVLSHYHKCRDTTCDVCRPVRSIIRSLRNPVVIKEEK